MEQLESLLEQINGNEYRKLVTQMYAPQWIDEYLKVHIFLPEYMRFKCNYTWLHFDKNIEKPLAWVDRGFPCEVPLIKF